MYYTPFVRCAVDILALAQCLVENRITLAFLSLVAGAFRGLGAASDGFLAEGDKNQNLNV